MLYINLEQLYMKKNYTGIVLFLLIASNLLSNSVSEAAVNFTSSNLPIIIINTSGQSIVDEPKITAHMGIIYNGVGNINKLTDPYNNYDGSVGIEIRGYSSSNWSDKKPYGFETRTVTGENNNVSLLGLPVENDWVLHAPIADKSLMRNKLVYDLAGEMGQYSPRTRYCEVVIDGDYRGVYVLVEKIKQDNDRVDLEAPDETNPSGGYILEMTVESRIESYETSFITGKTDAPFVVKYPDEEFITAIQSTYIEDYMNEFESVLFGNNLADPTNGYAKYIDVPSFIDHILLSEAFQQLDGLRSSQYFHKRKNGKLFMGPVWDFNRCAANYKGYSLIEYERWWMMEDRGGQRIPYVNQLMEDPVFIKQYSDRWFDLRDGILSNDNMMARIDGYASEVDEAKDRNFARWGVGMDSHKTDNLSMLQRSYNQNYTFETYEEAVNQLKDFVQAKFTWLDAAFEDYDPTKLTSSTEYETYAIQTQKGNFTVEYDWSPQDDDMNGLFALANISGEVNAYSDLACIARLNKDGEIDARNAGEYANDIEINYKTGEYYHMRMEVDVVSHTFDVFVTPKSTGEELHVASNYGFRTEQNAVTEINGFVLMSKVGSYKLRNFCLNDECNEGSTALVERVVNETRMRSYPNPFSESVTINLEQAETSLVNINIYSIDGRMVSQLHNGQLIEGIHDFNWDGNDMNGNELGNGVYFCRLISNGKAKTIKIVKTH